MVGICVTLRLRAASSLRRLEAYEGIRHKDNHKGQEYEGKLYFSSEMTEETWFRPSDQLTARMNCSGMMPI